MLNMTKLNTHTKSQSLSNMLRDFGSQTEVFDEALAMHRAADRIEQLERELAESQKDAARHRFCMDWQDNDSQPEEIHDMFRKVFATGRLKPTKEEYNAAIDAAINGVQE